MRRFGFFHPFFMSFYSRDLYADVAWNWKGTCFGYLFVLLLLAWVVTTARVHLWMTAVCKYEAPAVLEKIPTITIKDGKVSADVKQPYAVNLPDGQTLLVIDTTGQTKDLSQTPAQILLTKDTLHIRKNTGQTQSQDLSQIKDFRLDKAGFSATGQQGQQTNMTWIECMSWLTHWIAIGMFCFGLPCAFVYRILQTLVYAAVGTAFVQSFRGTLDFNATLRLAVIAVTPVIVLDTVLLLLWIDIPFWWPACIGIALGYLYFGVKSAVEAAPPSPTAEMPTEVRPEGAYRGGIG